MMRTPRLLLGLLVALLLALGPTVASGAGIERPSTGPTGERRARLLVFSVPSVTWEDLTEEATPNLRSFLDDAAVANLAARVTGGPTHTGEGYTTIGAGTRAVAPGATAAEAFSPDEPFGVGTAAETFERRTGHPLDGAAGLLSLAELLDANEEALFGAEPGVIGGALAEAGTGRAVVANADSPSTDPSDGSWSRRREAVTALMDPRGLLPSGRVDSTLVVEDPDAPGGVRFDPDVVEESFVEAWRDDTVVLVEASDLVRAREAVAGTSADQRDALFDEALAASDRLFGQLLESVDLERDTVLVVAPSTPAQARLTVAGVAGPDWSPGLLESGQTRRAGFVTLADVGPTILDIAGAAIPEGLEGRPVVVGEAGGSADERYDYLVSTEEGARFRDRLVEPFTTTYVLAQIAFLLLALWAVAGSRSPRWPAFVGLFLVAVLPTTYLAGFVDFESLGVAAYLGFVLSGAAALAGVAWLVSRRLLVPPAVVLGVDLAVIAVSVVLLGSDLQLNTVFGDSPIVAGRFTGINNLTFAQLAVAAIFLAACSVHWWPDRRGKALALAILAGAFAVDAMPMWGADVGGVLAAVPGFAVTAMLLLGLRVRWRAAIGWGGVTLAAIVALGLLDLTRSSSDRSHLGRLFERIGSDGAEGFTLVVQRKLDQNIRALTGQPWTWLVAATIVVAAYLLWRHRDRFTAVFSTVPELRAAAAGIVVVAVLGFALNDSGVAVPGMMLAIVNPVLVFLVLHSGAPVRLVRDLEPERPPVDIGSSA